MPYRAPELFDVKTGTTIDEKVDIWVRPHSLLISRFPIVFALIVSPIAVPRLHALRSRLRALAIRNIANAGPGWLARDGRYERRIQTSNERPLFRGV